MNDGVSPAGEDAHELIAIAVIVKPSGLNGACHVYAFGNTLESSELPCIVPAGRDSSNMQDLTIVECRTSAKGLICRFQNIDDRTAAEKIRGMYIYRQVDRLPQRGENEFYHFELEGMTAFAGSYGRPLGIVRTVMNCPTVDALEIERPGGSTIMIPFKKEFVIAIEREKRAILVREDVLDELL